MDSVTTGSVKTLASVHETGDTEDMPTTSLPVRPRKQESSTYMLCTPGQSLNLSEPQPLHLKVLCPTDHTGQWVGGCSLIRQRMGKHLVDPEALRSMFIVLSSLPPRLSPANVWERTELKRKPQNQRHPDKLTPNTF